MENRLLDLGAIIEKVRHDDLVKLVSKMLSTSKEAREEVTRFLDQKGYLQDNQRQQVYIEKFSDKLYEAVGIIESFNEYGGGPEYEEGNAYSNMNFVISLFEENKLPNSCREECIDILMQQYVIGNSGFEDAIQDWVGEIANQNEHWELIISYLQKSGSSYDQSIIMRIYRDILNDQQTYEQIRINHLHYGNDYFDYVQFLHRNGDREEALKFAKKGLKEGKGRLMDLYEYVIKRYQKDGERQQALELLCQYFRHQPSLSLYKSVLEYAGNADREHIKKQLYESFSDHFYSHIKVEIDFEERNYEAVLAYVTKQPRSYLSGRDMEKYEKVLRTSFPNEMIQHYQTVVQYFINQRKRKSYKEAAYCALHIKNIFSNVLGKPDEWNKYIHHLLTTYAKLRALQDEFKKVKEK
ncbi:hypothetical protein [Cytobacillus sp. FSL K6-0265]|uniref:hypothetical protein n=1 Tax=Cytobacillus sp. FSL K6-0265 TaxID=2921448 RepID=UPI0030FA4610